MAADEALAETEGSVSQTVRALLGLRDLILKGELAAGARISELALVDRLGVSRTPVRAALARLEAEGLLESLPSGGYTVRAFSAAEIHDAIEVRGTLEGLAARLAAERGVAPTELNELRDCVDAIDAVLARTKFNVDTFTDYVELNERFHRLLAELPKSRVVSLQLERAVNLPFASPSGFAMVQAKLPDARDVLVMAQAQHRAVVDAIANREGARAEALMREHARIARRNLDSALANQNIMNLVPGARLIRRRGERL
jgi:GntR family transcriptional regulator of vanillate catabolism